MKGVREITDESTTQLQQLALQKAKTLNDQANIVIAANAFLFSPFVGTLTGAKQLTGLLVSVPIIICGIGIFLNSGLIWYIYTIKKSIDNYNKAFSLAFESNEALPRLSDFFTSLLDFIKKYAPIVLLIAWSLCLGVVIFQIVLGMPI